MRAVGDLTMDPESNGQTLAASRPAPLASFLRSTSRGLSRGRAWLGKVLRPPTPDAPTRRFMAFSKRQWPRRKAGRDASVLLGLFAVPESVFCYAWVGNYLVERLDCQLEAYDFGTRSNSVVEKVFRSFGVRCTLNAEGADTNRGRAAALADELFSGLKTKWDLVNLTVDGLLIGDQIYDSYLRYHNLPTVQLDDPRLRQIIEDAVAIYFAAADYLRTTKVECLISDDYSYINSGIVTRLLLQAGVPVLLVLFGEPFHLLQLDPQPPNPAPGSQWHPYAPAVAHQYYRYREVFAQLAEAEKARALMQARQRLTARLSGDHDPLVFMHESTYGIGTGAARIFPETGRPRILVMLHDFIDSPHGFRGLLFPDFYEWIHFLLEHAQETPFDWYVKPHPSTTDTRRRAMNEANDKVLVELQARFPKIHFLPAATSNRQILEEGVSAMFTVYGTAGHEFAYAGIPVVNAGDNRHIAYSFNIHASSLDHYRDCIRQADRLKIEIDPREIEEFFYMNYLYLPEHFGAPVNPIDQAIYGAPEGGAATSKSALFDGFIAGVTPERVAGVADYLDRFFDAAGFPKSKHL